MASRRGGTRAWAFAPNGLRHASQKWGRHRIDERNALGAKQRRGRTGPRWDKVWDSWKEGWWEAERSEDSWRNFEEHALRTLGIKEAKKREDAN